MSAYFKKYGPAGLATYTGISVISFGSWFAAIQSGLDTKRLIQSWNQFQDRWTIKNSEQVPNLLQQQQEEAFTGKSDMRTQETNFWKQMGTNLIMTVAAHNLIFPIRFGLTLYLTPIVGRFLKNRHAFKLFMK